MIKTVKGGNVPTRKQIRKAERKAYKQNLKTFGKKAMKELDEHTAKTQALKDLGLTFEDIKGLTNEQLMKVMQPRLKTVPERKWAKIIKTIFNYKPRR